MEGLFSFVLDWLSVHPLRDDIATFTDVKTGEIPEHLEGIAAQERIAAFLAEAQTDVAATVS